MPGNGARQALLASCSGAVAVASTGTIMLRAATTVGRPGESIETGLDFVSGAWLAVHRLLAGANIYKSAHPFVAGIGPVEPASEHVPASLLWQAPFAILPPVAAVLCFIFVSILAVWAAVFLLAQPRHPAEVFLATCCGAFVILAGSGPFALLLGQPTAFMLLGLAILVRARRPWAGAVGFLLAATTLQVGLPLTLALIVLGGWPTVWRGIVLVLALSLPPVGAEIANIGFLGFVSTFISGASGFIGGVYDRIDLGAFLHRIGVLSMPVQVSAGIAVAALALAFLALLPPRLRRIDFPPVLSVVVTFTLLCTYHEPYDMLLLAGTVVPVVVVRDRSWHMLPVVLLAAISADLSGYDVALLIDPLALLGAGVLSAFAARLTAGAAAGPGNLQAPSPVIGGQALP